MGTAAKSFFIWLFFTYAEWLNFFEKILQDPKSACIFAFPLQMSWGKLVKKSEKIEDKSGNSWRTTEWSRKEGMT